MMQPLLSDRYDLEDYSTTDEEDRRRERAYSWRLHAHPDCRNPDHPGCVDCQPRDTENFGEEDVTL